MKKIVDWFCEKTGLRNDFACWRPPGPKSDVVSLTILRERANGEVYKYHLGGEDAKRWGQLILDSETRGFKELKWEIEKVQ